MPTYLTPMQLRERAGRTDLFLNKIAQIKKGFDKKGDAVTVTPGAAFTIPNGTLLPDGTKTKGKQEFIVSALSVYDTGSTAGTPTLGPFTKGQVATNWQKLYLLIKGAKYNKLGQEVTGPKEAKTIVMAGTLGRSKTIIGPIVSGKLEKTVEFGAAKKPTGTGASKNPDTKENERITLMIFEALLGKNNYKPKTKTQEQLVIDFNLLCRGKLGTHLDLNLSSIWPGLIGEAPEQKAWWRSYFLQFQHIEHETGLPDNAFDVFDYKEFMKFIEVDIIKAGPPSTKNPGVRTGKWPLFGEIKEKDSWNPADIWLVQNNRNYTRLIKRIEAATTINQINKLLREAFRGTGTNAKPKNPVIVGISLKKTGGVLHYDLVNLQVKAPILPHVNFLYMDIRAPFVMTEARGTKDIEPGELTSNIHVREVGKNGKTANCILSGGGKRNMVLEFGGQGAAKLGKVPIDLANDLLREYGYTIPDATWAETQWPTNNTKKTSWRTKLNKINQHTGGNIGRGKLFKWDDGPMGKGGTDEGTKNGTNYDTLFKNLTRASKYPSGGLRNKALVIMQILEFGYILAEIYDQTRGRTDDEPSRRIFDNVIEQFYYFAQKKGSLPTGARFGPFGKLH